MSTRIEKRKGLARIGQNMLASSYKFNKKAEKKKAWNPQKGGQELLAKSKADIILFGGAAGSGKSYGLLSTCANPKYLKVKGYNATVFRTSFPQITNPGGLLDESRLLYPELGGKVRLNPLDWNFENKSKISFRHIQYEKDLANYQGSQICLLGFDELTHFSENMFFYMLSRNRSGCGIRPRILATCNPDADSWVAKLIEWWIDQETGLPIKERRGKIRYFVRRDEEIHWGNSQKELQEKFGQDTLAKSFTFIYGTVKENKKLLEKDPNYIANLQSLHPVEKARLLYGNWKIRLEAGVIFDRTWFQLLNEDKMPKVSNTEKISVRFWDFAATSKDTANSAKELNKAYYTANMKMTKIRDEYYIEDVKYKRIKGGNILEWMCEVAREDGEEVRIRWELEGGSAAKIVADDFRKTLLEQNQNYDVRAIKPQGDKVTRALKVATSASRSEIFVLDNEIWLSKFLNATQDFDGSRKPLINDIIDSLSGCYNELENAIIFNFDENSISSVNPSQYHEFYNVEDSY